MKARLPEGMGKGPGNVQQMIKEAQKIQEEVQRVQALLDEKEYDVSSGGGVCTVKILGTKEIKEIKLDPMIVDPDDIETLQDIIVAGVNEAYKLVESTNEAELSKVTGGLKLG